jgi:2-polyprenyl-3-methyl-5-hydroxy-6-metoxy-1,4-benzoquinol methylase
MNTDLIQYYKERAKEYEQVYLKPERQDDIQSTTSILQEQFLKKKVFEIACGTGFWTERIAQTATSVLATDINETVLEVARQKKYSPAQVIFERADIFNYCSENKYESVFGGFIWSHIPLQSIDKFLRILNSFTSPDGTIVLMDNNFVQGSNSPITYTDEDENTFQTRRLEDGTMHLIMKNFPTENFLREKLADMAFDIQYIKLKYFWILCYKPLNNEGA